MTDTFLDDIVKGYLLLQEVTALSYDYNPRKLVYTCDKLKLYHYQPKTKRPHSTPVLVVFATVNRPEILDLFPDHSFIGGLLANGMDVYLLDWGYPDEHDKDITLGDYITHYLKNTVDYICEHRKKKQINLLGICQGGLICLCFASLYNLIKNLVLISAPIDFATDDNKVAKILTYIDADNLVGSNGNVSGAWLSGFFISLRPFELVGQKYLRLVDRVNDASFTTNFLQVEKWLNDAPDQTGASFTQLIRDCYQQNKLIKNELILNSKKIDLRNVTIPVLNVMASQDEIVPISATKVLGRYIGSSNYTEQFFPSGHIGIYVSHKVGESMSSSISNWLKNSK